MQRLTWLTEQSVAVGGILIPCCPRLADQPNHVSGIRPVTRTRRLAKQFIRPLARARNAALISGFIVRSVGRLVRLYADRSTTLLDVQCHEVVLGESER